MTLNSYPTLTSDECFRAGSEIEKFRHKILPYAIKDGMPMPFIEIASGGAYSVPWAVSFDLPRHEYARYNSNQSPRGPIHVRGHCDALPFEDDSFFGLGASHLVEDLHPEHRQRVIKEFARVVMHGGYVCIAVPEHDLWWEYVRHGGPHNHAHHQPQPRLGDMSALGRECGLDPVLEELTKCYPGDHTILCILQKP